MFDELFKGTNVKDAYDGTLAATEAFAEYRACLFIVSTHIIEVGEVLKQYDKFIPHLCQLLWKAQALQVAHLSNLKMVLQRTGRE